MAYNLRLPAALDADARERCTRLGISLNALLCVALDAYLRQPEQPEAQAPQGIPATQTATSSPANSKPGLAGREANAAGRPAPVGQPPQPGLAKLSKAQRREITRLERQARKL